MSDKIRYTLEKHIPDLLALQKRRIFSEEEVKDILQNREQFEYDLQRRTHGLKDYMKVLDYEYRLERQRRAKAQELGIKKFNNRDFTIVKRIINLWDRIMNKYRYRIDLWKQYLCFCYKINSKKQFFKVITNALRFNPFCIDIWIIGGIYEYEIAKNPFKARKIFYQGLRSNSNSKQLWCEYLKFELTFLDSLTNQDPKKEENETFISFVQDDKPQFTYKPNLDGVKTIIQLSTENCSDITTFTEMIQILKDHDQNELADKLLIAYQEKIKDNPEYLKQHLQQQVVSTETALNLLNLNKDPKNQIIILQLIQEINDIDFPQIVQNLLDINVTDHDVIENLVKLRQHINQQQKDKLIILIQASNGDDFTKLQQLNQMGSQKSIIKQYVNKLLLNLKKSQNKQQAFQQLIYLLRYQDKLDEIYELAKINLMGQKDLFKQFLDEYFKNINQSKHQNIINQLVQLQQFCPLEYHIKYFETKQPSYTQLVVFLQQFQTLDAWKFVIQKVQELYPQNLTTIQLAINGFPESLKKQANKIYEQYINL